MLSRAGPLETIGITRVRFSEDVMVCGRAPLRGASLTCVCVAVTTSDAPPIALLDAINSPAISIVMPEVAKYVTEGEVLRSYELPMP